MFYIYINVIWSILKYFYLIEILFVLYLEIKFNIFICLFIEFFFLLKGVVKIYIK